jgi:3-hydroxyacyl-CoA dehydrogenase
MKPLVVRSEIDGFLADRLLEALWREALWLVNDGVATVEEVDDAIRYGAGLRWAFMGTFLTYRIAGGEQGMRHFLSQFGPALEWPWTHLTDVPELTDELAETIAAQSDEQADGMPARELELHDSLGSAQREVEEWALRMHSGNYALPLPAAATHALPLSVQRQRAANASARKAGLFERIRSLLPRLQQSSSEKIERLRLANADAEPDLRGLHFAATE